MQLQITDPSMWIIMSPSMEFFMVNAITSKTTGFSLIQSWSSMVMMWNDGQKVTDTSGHCSSWGMHNVTHLMPKPYSTYVQQELIAVIATFLVNLEIIYVVSFWIFSCMSACILVSVRISRAYSVTERFFNECICVWVNFQNHLTNGINAIVIGIFEYCLTLCSTLYNNISLEIWKL